MNEHYCGTANNQTPSWLSACFASSDCSYGIGVEEKAPTTGTKHMQFYVQYNSRKRITTVFKQFPGCHIESCKGSSEDNYNYVRKSLVTGDGAAPVQDSLEVVKGVIRTIQRKHTGQGSRSDLIDLKNRLINGELSIEDILLEYPDKYHQYGRTLEKIDELVQRKRRRPEVMPECIWYYGPTGTGKSHRARQHEDDSTYYWPDDNGWWDTYNGEKTIIFNEFRGNIRFKKLLEICDKWNCDLSRRGRGPAKCMANRIIITSSLHPSDCYNNLAADDRIEQLYRRFTIIELTEVFGSG